MWGEGGGGSRYDTTSLDDGYGPIPRKRLAAIRTFVLSAEISVRVSLILVNVAVGELVVFRTTIIGHSRCCAMGGDHPNDAARVQAGKSNIENADQEETEAEDGNEEEKGEGGQ